MERKIKILSNDGYNKKSLEYQLIEYVNNDPISVIENPVNVISKNLYIDTSSLTRLIRKIGFKNYKNFRNFVVEQIVKYKNDLLNCKTTGSKDLLKNSIIVNNLTIKDTIESNDNSEFDKAIDEIIAAKKIYLFGIGFTYFICQHITKFLELSRIHCCNIINFYDALQFATTSIDNIWIIVSITLITKEIVFLLEALAEKNRNKIIVITSNYESPILKKVSYILKLKSNNLVRNEIFNLNLKVGLTALANLIILKVLDKIELNKIDQIIENKQKKKKIIFSFIG